MTHAHTYTVTHNLQIFFFLPLSKFGLSALKPKAAQFQQQHLHPSGNRKISQCCTQQSLIRGALEGCRPMEQDSISFHY